MCIRDRSISPLKNAQKINEIGEELAEIYKVPHLTSDFKKKNGYKRSIELSHALYRQNYCGCVFSKKEAMDRERLVTENRTVTTAEDSKRIIMKNFAFL